MNVNKVFILGNLTNDPIIRRLPSGQDVASFGVATNRFWIDKQSGEKKSQAEFHNIIAFGKLANIVSQFLKKGSLVYVEGRLHTRNWQDSQGIKHYRTEIIAERLQLGPKLISTQPETEQIPEIEEETPLDDINPEEIPF
jgi:single-strand DNA-binding protein